MGKSQLRFHPYRSRAESLAPVSVKKNLRKVFNCISSVPVGGSSDIGFSLLLWKDWRVSAVCWVWGAIPLEMSFLKAFPKNPLKMSFIACLVVGSPYAWVPCGSGIGKRADGFSCLALILLSRPRVGASRITKTVCTINRSKRGWLMLGSDNKTTES